jgi:ATP-dependent Zn protease
MSGARGGAYVAYHEAGHAVIRFVLGLPFNSVVIYEPGEAGDRGGAVAGCNTGEDIVDPRRIAAEAVSYMAGVYAEARRSHTSIVAVSLGARQDVSIASEAAAAAGCDEEAVWERAGQLVRKHWADIETVAEELLLRRRLSYTDVEVLVRADALTREERRVRNALARGGER